MTIQVTVRLPDDLVEFVDRRVRDGKATSRAAVVAAALERERRRALAERDAAILATTGEADQDDFDALARFAAGTSIEPLD